MTETAAAWLERRGAQRDVIAWAESYGDDWGKLWRDCPRGDWLLALALRRGAPPESVLLAARRVATLALDHVEGDEREAVQNALTTPSTEATSAIEARADASIDPAHGAALSAVVLALRGAPDDAAMVPLLLAQAAAMDAAECGMSAAVSYVQRRSAELVREVIADIPDPERRG